MAEGQRIDVPEHVHMSPGTSIHSRNQSRKIVFLGGGRITAALLSGLRLANYHAPIVVHDRNLHKLHALKKEFGITVEPDLLRAVEQAHLLILAVRPANVVGVLQELELGRRESKGFNGRARVLACSLAAGIPLARLQKLGPQFRWSRAMPSPVARTGNGLTAVTLARRYPGAAREVVRNFFARVGAVVEIPESRFDTFTVTFSPSHGYHALKGLAEAGQQLGLDRKTAFAAAAHALADAIYSWREGKESLDALLQEAATPGGIAATVMRSMDDSGHVRMVRKALRAGVQRARANARLR
jgi:pyrroline-5-carboxylate reductase